MIKNLIFIINFPSILQSLLLLSPSKEYKYTFLLFILSASTEQEGSSRNIYSTSSLFSAISQYNIGHTCYCQKLLGGSELVPE